MLSKNELRRVKLKRNCDIVLDILSSNFSKAQKALGAISRSRMGEGVKRSFVSFFSRNLQKKNPRSKTLQSDQFLENLRGILGEGKSRIWEPSKNMCVRYE